LASAQNGGFGRAMFSNLPVEMTSFIGREREIVEVSRLLGGTRLLTLTGTGGCGKTRLALQVAASAATDHTDSVALVEFAALTDPALVPSAVLGALRLREEASRPISDTLIDHLVPRPCLLVMDNCEHLLDGVAVLAESLLRACPGLRILATSRQPLGIGGETAWRVLPLTIPPATDGDSATDALVPNGSSATRGLLAYESVRLFVDRAAAASPGFSLTDQNAAAVAEICRRLDGIPLALQLAAARIRAMAVEQIAARLDDRLRLLTNGSRTALPRQQTLRGTLDWSYELLSEPERVLLCRLAVFVGGWTLEAAEQVCGALPLLPDSLPGRGSPEQSTADENSPFPTGKEVGGGEPDVLDLLTGLVDKSLVVAEARDGATRYHPLETLRQYAQERLESSGEADMMRHRHAECYLALAEEAEPQLRGSRQAVLLERLKIEHDNLRAALDWLAGHDPELGLRLGAALWRYWDTHGHISEGRERLAALVERGGERGRAAALVLHGQGILARKQGDYDAARDFHEKSLTIFREIGDREGIAHAFNSLGAVFHARGSFETARAMREESLAHMRELGDEWGTAAALSNLALVLKDVGDVAAALPLEEESLTLARRLGDRRTLGNVLNNLGVTAKRLGDLATSRVRHEENLAIKRELGDLSGIGHSLANLGNVALLQRDYDAACAWFGEGLHLTRQLGDRLMLAVCLHGVGAVTAARGKDRDAVRLYGAAEAVRHAIGTRLAEPRRADDDQRIDAARATLGDEDFAIAWTEGQSMPLDEAIVGALSVAAAGAASESPAGGGVGLPLTAREREVAVRLAQGFTNRRIAEELVVATSTVDTHVINILRKLDLSSRAQVAAWAVEHGLFSSGS
jgi:non-specific serine/threonine protein kinase